jgi:hypothetical protein
MLRRGVGVKRPSRPESVRSTPAVQINKNLTYKSQITLAEFLGKKIEVESKVNDS